MENLILDATSCINTTLQAAFEPLKRSWVIRALPGQHRYVVYIDHAALEAVTAEIVPTQVNDPKLKINQFKAHLTKDVKPFNARALNIERNRIQSAVLTLEVHSVANIEEVREQVRTGTPVKADIKCSWGEPDPEKRKALRQERAAKGETEAFGIPSEWKGQLEACGIKI